MTKTFLVQFLKCSNSFLIMFFLQRRLLTEHHDNIEDLDSNTPKEYYDEQSDNKRNSIFQNCNPNPVNKVVVQQNIDTSHLLYMVKSIHQIFFKNLRFNETINEKYNKGLELDKFWSYMNFTNDFSVKNDEKLKIFISLCFSRQEDVELTTKNFMIVYTKMIKFLNDEFKQYHVLNKLENVDNCFIDKLFTVVFKLVIKDPELNLSSDSIFEYGNTNSFILNNDYLSLDKKQMKKSYKFVKKNSKCNLYCEIINYPTFMFISSKITRQYFESKIMANNAETYGNIQFYDKCYKIFGFVDIDLEEKSFYEIIKSYSENTKFDEKRMMKYTLYLNLSLKRRKMKNLL